MWQEFQSDKNEWNQLIASFDPTHPTHAYLWNQISHGSGILHHLVYKQELSSTPTAAIQIVQKRTRFGLNYFRSDGGIAGDQSTYASLKDWILENSSSRWWYLRVWSRLAREPEAVTQIKKAGFSTVFVPIHSGMTCAVQLAQPYQESYSSNWRHNLNRSQKKGLQVSILNSSLASVIAALYDEVEKTKSLSRQFSLEELESIITNHGPNIKYVEVRSEENQPLALRAALILKDKAFDLFAATGDQGRKMYASNLACHTLLASCAEAGIREYDFAGVDPLHGEGVMNFKLGAGGKLQEYLGEWDLASSNIIRILANVALWRKLAG